MKLLLTIIVTNFLVLTSLSQSPVDFSKFPNQQGDTVTLIASELLEKINWQAIKSFCKTAQGHYVDENNDSLLITYKYAKQGYESYFEIVSYKGTVLEFYADAGNEKQSAMISYFDKNTWLKYVDEKLPSLPERFKLTKEEESSVLKAYYRLVGVNTSDEYGFICEYSAMGIATARRTAVIQLLQQRRIDLLHKLVEYSNLQTRLYAIDALIYYDYSVKRKIEEIEQDIKQKQKQLDRLLNKKTNESAMKGLESQIKVLADSVTFYRYGILTDNEWKVIYDLRNSNQMVSTCGNMGSYKIYGTPISELLSAKAIADIPKRYEGLRKLGYFRWRL